MAPKNRNFTFLRGDTWPLADTAVTFSDGRTLLTAGVVLRSTLKRYENQEDPSSLDPLVDAVTGVIQLDSQSRGGITVLSASSFRVVFPPELTELLPVDDYDYDIVIDFSAGESYTLWRGRIKNTSDITLARTP